MGHHPEGPHRLSFLKSPLIVTEKAVSASSSQHDHEHSQYGVAHGNTQYDPEHGPNLGLDDAAMHETPQFQHHEEATTIELFYDLFFVANLTTFTSLHEINEGNALKSYAGFFCILWFTWCQASLFDVRFVADSLVERIAKACQFAVMIGLAVIGPKFDPAKQDGATFRTMALILMFGRLILAAQYLIVLFHVRGFKRSKTPMGLISVVYILAGMAYGLTWFGLRNKTVIEEGEDGAVESLKVANESTYIAWYVIAGIETILNIAVTSRWKKVLSFKGTHLVQRMSLLTLIIMGEGIIVVAKSISKIVKNQKAAYAWTPATIGTVTASVLIIYLLYMLYFDWYSHHHFGSIRQQFWAIIHFPFHLALVLFMEGIAQFIIFRKLIDVYYLISNQLFEAVQAWADNNGQGRPSIYGVDDIRSLQQTLNVTGMDIFTQFPPKEFDAFFEFYDMLDGFDTLIGTYPRVEDITPDFNTTLRTKLEEMVEDFSATMSNSIFQSYGVVLPEKKTESMTSLDKFSANIDVFGLVFLYFFIAAGLTLILMNILNLLSRRNKPAVEWFKIGFNFFVGVTLCAVTALYADGERTLAYIQTSWVIPVPAIGLTLVLLVNHLHRYWKH